MLEAYLGIATHRGLEFFVPEHSRTAQLVRERIRLTPGKGSSCFWSVLPSESAIAVTRAVEVGDGHHALRLIENLALDGGAYLPFDS